MALPKANRLRQRRDFSTVYQKGLRRSTRHLTLRALRLLRKGTPDDLSHLRPTQIGISISTKVSKRAVIRNRIKRWIKAVLRQFLPRLSSGWQIVIVVKPGAQECHYGEFLQELEQLLADIEVLNGR
ncbi:MAG: ribonuclease P protein component [Leptolyngbyaceae bacterium]|nr:ribonuclease P protein component [Leptolyngbyaceae bacterium]